MRVSGRTTRWTGKVHCCNSLGTLSYANGDRFEGTWEQDVIVGKGRVLLTLGTHYYANGEKRTGTYVDGVIVLE